MLIYDLSSRKIFTIYERTDKYLFSEELTALFVA